jgi:hypothetical protein
MAKGAVEEAGREAAHGKGPAGRNAGAPRRQPDGEAVTGI